MGFIRGSLAALLALGLVASTAFAGADLRDYDRGKDVREEVRAEEPAPVAKAVHEHGEWHCAQGGGAHFNILRPSSADDCDLCDAGCDHNIIGDWDHRPAKHHDHSHCH